MSDMRMSAGFVKWDIPVITLDVPKQPVGSNDCGVYLLENCKLLLQNTEELLQKAEENSCGSYYSRSVVQHRRKEIAEHLERLGEEQRLSDGIHEGLPDLKLPNLYHQVSHIFFLIIYKLI